MHMCRAFGSIAIAVGVVVAWALASRRRWLPYPSWLSWGIDNPLADRLLATEQTLDRIGLEPGQRVLEIGPGSGRLLIPAASRVLPGGEVVGLDIQEEMVEKLTARAARMGIANLTAIVGDASTAIFSPGQFDVVYLCAVLGEIGAREAALRQCHRVLKQGGRLSITEGQPDPHMVSFDTVLRLAEDSGFHLTAHFGGRLRYTANLVRL